MGKIDSIAVIGAGNGGYAISANLALKGFHVNLYELPSFEKNIEIVKKTKKIRVIKNSGEKIAKLNEVTSDIKKAIEGTNCIFIAVPTFAHRYFFRKIVNYLERDQIIVLTPGNMSSLILRNLLKNNKFFDDIRIVETNTLPYGCRKTSSEEIEIHVEVKKLLAATFPAKGSGDTLKILKGVYPSVFPVSNVLETTLNNENPVVHPAATILNIGRIEYAKGNFYLYKEGISSSVERIIDEIDKERLRLCNILGFMEQSVDKICTEQGYKSTIEQKINATDALPHCKGPSDKNSRFITEDVPYGLVTWESLGRVLEYEMPTTRSIIQFASVINSIDYFKEGRTVEKLGISNLSPDEIKKFLENGYL